MHVGAASLLQAPVARHVVVAFPLNVYPALHEYLEVDPVVPIVEETVPNVGSDNDGVHAVPAK